MSLKAAALLDEAFDLYLQIAGYPDTVGIPRQSPGGEGPKSPYDFAAGLCMSLFPYVYGYKPEDTEITDLIWTETVDRMEVLSLQAAQEFTHTCNTCGHSLRSYGHYVECTSRGAIAKQLREAN